MSCGGKLTRASARAGFFPLMSLAKQYRRLYFWLFQPFRGSCYFCDQGAAGGGGRGEGEGAGDRPPTASSIGSTCLAIVLQLPFNCNVRDKGWPIAVFVAAAIKKWPSTRVMILLNFPFTQFVFRVSVFVIYSNEKLRASGRICRRRQKTLQTQLVVPMIRLGFSQWKRKSQVCRVCLKKFARNGVRSCRYFSFLRSLFVLLYDIQGRQLY